MFLVLILNNLQLFCLFLMITSSLLYASIFGHVTTIIHNMTLAAAKYHDMLNNVREFMVLNEVNKDIFEVLFPLINRCLAISQNVSPITLSQSGQTLREWSRIRWKSRLLCFWFKSLPKGSQHLSKRHAGWHLRPPQQEGRIMLVCTYLAKDE